MSRGGLEPPTHWLKASCSTELSYRPTERGEYVLSQSRSQWHSWTKIREIALTMPDLLVLC
jgi:hypothetical protein